MRKILISLILALTASYGVLADGFRVTTLRAAPGKLDTLIQKIRAYKSDKYDNVVIMRHSQGDNWDLMLMEPSGLAPTKFPSFGDVADFQHSFLVLSDTKWGFVKGISAQAGLFHIEMFHASAGKRGDLIRQRQMENEYLATTGRKANAIFATTFGSDVDVFTIGFYKDMPHFAAIPNLPADALEKAAIKSGFTNREDIGLSLRGLIISHHDTLATRVD